MIRIWVGSAFWRGGDLLVRLHCSNASLGVTRMRWREGGVKYLAHFCEASRWWECWRWKLYPLNARPIALKCSGDVASSEPLVEIWSLQLLLLIIVDFGIICSQLFELYIIREWVSFLSNLRLWWIKNYLKCSMLAIKRSDRECICSLFNVSKLTKKCKEPKWVRSSCHLLRFRKHMLTFVYFKESK